MNTASFRIHTNVRPAERVVTLLAGAGLFALALKMPRVRRPLGAASMALLLRGATGYCPAYAAADAAVDGTDTRHALAGAKGEHIDARVSIAQRPAAVYAFWRDLSQLARALPGTIAVERITDVESRWSISGSGGMPGVHWTARIINDEPGRLIAWKTLENADVVSAGSVHFASAADGRHTDVHVRFQYSPPLGHIGARLAGWFGPDPHAEVSNALTRIKQFVEHNAEPWIEPE